MYKCKCRARLVLLLILSVLFSSSLTGCASSVSYKNSIFSAVETHQATLLVDIAKNDFTESLSIPPIESANVLENCVSFDCGGHGISTSSHEFGFYYSYDDQPLGVWGQMEFCSSEALTVSGNGFSGDLQNNLYYTEKICDYFWYYELHF